MASVAAGAAEKGGTCVSGVALLEPHCLRSALPARSPLISLAACRLLYELISMLLTLREAPGRSRAPAGPLGGICGVIFHFGQPLSKASVRRLCDC